MERGIEIEETFDEKEAVTILALKGAINTTSVSELTDRVEKVIPKTITLVLDMKEVNYVASAGLRGILIAHKSMQSKGGKLLIRNVSEAVMGVFTMTGFSMALTIE